MLQPTSMDASGPASAPRELEASATPAEPRAPSLELSRGREIALLVTLYVAYTVGRLVADAELEPARARARALQCWEARAHLGVESFLNARVSGQRTLELTAAYWYSAAHYLVTPIILIWLWRRHPEWYGVLRSTLALGTFVALVVYIAAPTAPPRLLSGYEDTLARTAWAGWWSGDASVPRGLGAASNQLAAMPSMHVGWALWVAISVAVAARGRLRHLAWFYPAVTTLVVLATANHWVVDAAAGALIIAVAYVLNARFPGRRPNLRHLKQLIGRQVTRSVARSSNSSTETER
jgi:hypothetical protein